MLIVLPIRTSIRPRSKPYVNYALIFVNVAVFVLSYWPYHDPVTGMQEFLRTWASQFMLKPVNPQLWQFVTYAFLHSGMMHIIGNMFFLYLFGNNVNDKLGSVSYLCLYLGGAVFAGVGHSLWHTNPVLGASGAVAAVTGAYLVFFPQTLITVFYWFFYLIGTMELSALYFIGFKLIFWDNIIEPRFSLAAVAYDAHLAGYVFGAAASLLLLAAGLVTSTGFDLWVMIRQWNRRRQYRHTVAAGYDPFTGRTPSRQVRATEIKSPAQQQQEQKVRELRSEIAARITERNLSAAADRYLELIALDEAQLLPRQHLLDVANQAARAYETFLAHYSNYEYVEQVQLMLGVIYARYLNKSDLARRHLEAASRKLSDPSQLKMCREQLQRLRE